MKNTKVYKDYKSAKQAYEDVQANNVKIADNLALVFEQEEELRNQLEIIQSEHDTAMDEAAGMGDMSLLDRVTDKINKTIALVEAKENERLLTEKVLAKAEQLVKLKRDEFRDREKYLLLATAEKLEGEVIHDAADKLKIAWMARSRATGHYSPDIRDRWFKDMFPWPQDDDYSDLGKLFE